MTTAHTQQPNSRLMQSASVPGGSRSVFDDTRFVSRIPEFVMVFRSKTFSALKSLCRWKNVGEQKKTYDIKLPKRLDGLRETVYGTYQR